MDLHSSTSHREHVETSVRILKGVRRLGLVQQQVPFARHDLRLLVHRAQQLQQRR